MTCCSATDEVALKTVEAGDALGMPGFSPGATDTNRVNIVKRGAKGGTVKWVQKRAGNLVVDGDFGPKTETRIKELQDADQGTSNGLRARGRRQHRRRHVHAADVAQPSAALTL